MSMQPLKSNNKYVHYIKNNFKKHKLCKFSDYNINSYQIL